MDKEDMEFEEGPDTPPIRNPLLLYKEAGFNSLKGLLEKLQSDPITKEPSMMDLPEEQQSNKWALVKSRSTFSKENLPTSTLSQPADAQKSRSSSSSSYFIMKTRKKMKKSKGILLYTDTSRAAAVDQGARDIKENLKKEGMEMQCIPDKSEINALVSQALRERTYNDRTLQMLDKVLEIEPNNISCLVARSKRYAKLHDLQSALVDIDNALKYNNKNTQVLIQKADIMYFLGYFEDALLHYTRGILLRPDIASFRLGVQKTERAISDSIVGNKEETIEQMKEFLEKESKSVRVHHDRREKPTRTTLMFKRDRKFLRSILKSSVVDVGSVSYLNQQIQDGVKEALAFIYTREQFWRDMEPPTEDTRR